MTGESLVKLAAKYFALRGYEVKEETGLEGLSGMRYRFDLSILKAKKTQLVSVLDWKKSVGVNMVLNVDKASEDVRIPDPILVAPTFSDHAKAYSHRRGVTLITKREITNELSRARAPSLRAT